jgi:amidase
MTVSRVSKNMTGGTAPRVETDELWRWPATELARAIASGALSSREVVTSCLRRIDEVNPRLNALVEVRAEESLAAAKVADDMVASRAKLGPLHGIPVAIKVNSDQAGYATTNGVVAFMDIIASKDSAEVAALRRAGAVLVGRSNCPAFTFRWFTDNDLHGRTLNPWDASRTPGGSSGGASAAVASGMVPVAQGNDIGGSIRYPAYACGIAGLRPTVGRVAHSHYPPGQDQALSVQMMLVDGPLTRRIDDLRLAYLGMSSTTDPRDPVHAPGAAAMPLHNNPRRVGLLRDVGIATPTPAVNKSLDDAANRLRTAGYQVEEIELPLLAEAWQLWWLLALEEFRTIMPLVEQHGDEGIKKAAAGYYACAAEWWGQAPGLAEYMNGYARRGTLISQLAQFMLDYPLVLLPVSAEQAFELDLDIASVEACRRAVNAQWSMMAIALLGFPALAIPTGVVDGLPVGVQLLGRRFDEASMLDAGAVVEAATGTLTPIEPR